MNLILSRRDVDFLLYEWLDAVSLSRRTMYAAHDKQVFDAVLDLSETLAREEFAPHNKKSDANEPRYQGASVLLARANFGCGSSREHAPWAILDYGFRAIIAPSYADIFYNNCFKNGLLPVTLADAEASELFRRAENTPGYRLTVDLESQTVADDSGLKLSFTVDPFRRECLLNGWDEIGLTLRQEAAISDYEKEHPQEIARPADVDMIAGGDRA